MRIAMFNLENLDDETGQDPSLATRVAIMRPQLDRIAADILCLHARGSGFASSSTSRWSWCPAAPNPSSPTNPWPHSAAGCRGRPSVPGPSTTLVTSGSPAGPAALDGWWWPRPRSPPSLPASSSPMPPRSRSSRATAPATNGSTMASSTPTRPSAATSATTPSTRPSNRSGHGGRSQETDSLDPSRSPGADHDSACSPSGRR